TARPVLQALGVWESVAADRHLPAYGNLSAWGSDDLWGADFLFHPHGPGLQLDRRRFDEQLVRAAGAAGAEVHYGCRFLAARRSPMGWVIETIDPSGPAALAARWLIDATGRRALVGRKL